MKSFLNKRILVAGAGAIGSFYGGFLSKAGYNVELLARGEHLTAMGDSGKLAITSYKYGDHEIDVKAVSEATGQYDILLICVKSGDTAVTCGQLRNNLKQDGCVVSFQNGVENPQTIAGFFGSHRTLAASLFIGLSIDPPGKVNHTSSGGCTFGGWTDESKKYENMLKNIFDNSGIESNISNSIKHTVWSKLVWNVGYNPLSALLDSTCGPMINSEITRPLIENMVREVVAAAAIHGVTITEEEWQEKIAYRETLKNYKTSMLQDIEKHRNPEIDGILGPVIRTLENNGQKAPYCETVYRALQFKFGSHFIHCPKLTVDMIVRKGDSILLIERKNEPYGWALPGGFVDYGETVENAAVRELAEETGIYAENIEMLGVFSDPLRDKRGHTVSVVFQTQSDQNAKAGDDAKKAVFYKLNELPDNIVFDHLKIINSHLSKF